MFRYNLVDEDWIPCAERAGGVPRLLSLRAVFAEAPQLVTIADPSPVITISLYRLLLAILHRSLDGPGSIAGWKAVWEAGHWDLNRINRYLDTWHARFDLFDAQRPFYQTPDLNHDYLRPVTQLAQERASDRNGALLFDHTYDDVSLAPAAAARYLIAMHNFAVGGLYSYDGKREPIANKYVSQAPLLGAAVVLARGERLFQTLMLNWVRYNRAEELPFPFMDGRDDQPAWEREGGAKPEKRSPDGYVDLLTWQSRRILLVPKALASDGAVCVRGAVLMKGYQFADGFEHNGAETMLAFRKSTNPKLGLAWFPVKLDPDRVIWRDSQTLMESVREVSERPKTMQWLDKLVTGRALEEQRLAPLEIYGMIPDQANILDWRRESLPVRLRLLTQDEAVTQHLLQRLREGIQFAEEAGRLFKATLMVLGSGPRDKRKSPMWILCEALLAGGSEREAKREDCEQLALSFGTGPRYWARLDTPFRGFLEGLADPGDVAVEDGATVYGMRALRQWANAVKRATEAVFQEVVDGLDTSAKALRAAALGQREFRSQLSVLLRSRQLHVQAVEREKAGVSV